MSDIKHEKEVIASVRSKGDAYYIPAEEDLIAETQVSGTDSETIDSKLRKVPAKIPWSCWLVALVELCERFSYYGLSGPFQNYMTKEGDGLGLKRTTANALSYFFQFWCYVCPVFGAWVSDTFWGKYKTICVFAIVYVVGILILFLTSLPVSVRNGHAFGGYVTSLVVIGLGTGGVKANVSPLIADQIPQEKEHVITTKKGERVIVSPAVTIQTVFMVFYLCINIGSLSAIATTELEANVGFWAAFLLPLCFFFVGLAALFLGKNVYVKTPPSRSTINNAFRILLTVVFNKFNWDSVSPSARPEKNYPWTDHFVQEVKVSFMACKVFVFYPIYWVVYGQMMNNFVTQAGQMETHKIPNDLMQNIDPIALIIFIPIFERIVYPAMRKMGIAFKPVTRITWGFYFAALSMAYSAIVQHLIYRAGPCYDAPLACPASMDGTIPNAVHVAVQTPAYVLVAFSEIFASITGLEYAYTKSPPSMKSFIMSIFLLMNAFGAAIGIALSPTAVDPKLVWSYTGLAVAVLIAGGLFWLLFKHYNKLEDDMNEISARVDADNDSESSYAIASGTGIEEKVSGTQEISNRV